MRSKIAKRILDETPKHVRDFVRRYAQHLVSLRSESNQKVMEGNDIGYDKNRQFYLDVRLYMRLHLKPDRALSAEEAEQMSNAARRIYRELESFTAYEQETLPFKTKSPD